MKTKSASALSALFLALPAFSEEVKAPVEFTPETVIIERFEANDAKISDVIEALTVLAEASTKKAWHPNFILEGDGAADKTVSMSLTNAPLADALAVLAKVPDVSVTSAKEVVTIVVKKSAAP